MGTVSNFSMNLALCANYCVEMQKKTILGKIKNRKARNSND